jgi:pyruvate,water dikinase
MQGLVEPFTAMGISVFRVIARGLAAFWGVKPGPGEAPPAFKVAAGRLFIDVTGAIKHPRLRPVLLAVSAMVDRPTSETLKSLVEHDERFALTGGRLPARYPFGFILTVAARVLYTVLLPDAARRQALEAAAERIEGMKLRAGRLKGVAERVCFVEEVLTTLLPGLFARMGPVIAPGLAARFITEDKLQGWLGDAAGLQPVLRSLPHNPTTMMDLELWRISRTLKVQGLEPSAEHPEVGAFLKP